MAANLVVIEAPGKRKELSNLLWKAGLRDVEVVATGGHIGTNPDRFRPLAIDSDYREIAYRLKPQKERVASEIGRAAEIAQRVFLATDDDQEGDVIARDVLRFCIEPQHHPKVLRVRLKALVPSEVKAALNAAQPFDALSAARGDARRVVDRLIGALSNEDGAVGRVQGSLLLLLQEQHPIAGVMTYALPATDDKGDWIARVPLAAGQEPPASGEVEGRAAVGRVELATLAGRVMDHDTAVLSASLATGGSIGEVADAMQRLYERGHMTYPRSKDSALSPDSLRRLHAIARIAGAGFDASRFKAVREMGAEHGHEAPNSTLLDTPVNRPLGSLGFDEQVLVHITRNLIDCGIPCQFETPRLADLGALPDALADLRWHRLVPLGNRLWEPERVAPGFKAWSPEQSVLHFMSSNGLGRPSTTVQHVEKFLGRDLVDQAFDLTAKGREWTHNVGHLFGHQNISLLIEDYLENNRKEASLMVADIVELCRLTAVGSAVQQQRIEHDDDEAFEVHGGGIP